MGALHTLVTSALVGAAGSVRASVEVAGLAVRRTPSLVACGARSTVAGDADAARASAVFRDELLTLLDDVAEIASREARRARLELGERTATAVTAGAPRRRHRVKA
ncbi:MAG TPA: hypothetical protein VMP89_06540 [Solirubrobacteraceae bacterium]|nr:hypothetical protein [Solirubrobacteraceae bacterium]